MTCMDCGHSFDQPYPLCPDCVARRDDSLATQSQILMIISDVKRERDEARARIRLLEERLDAARLDDHGCTR